MKKILCTILSIIIICNFFTSCQKIPQINKKDRIILNLSKELQNEQMELNCLPWFSTPQDAIGSFNLSLNEVAIREGTFNGSPDGTEMYLPVYLEDLEISANMILYFRSNYPLLQEEKTLKKALTDVSFIACFADEAEKEAYVEKLRQSIDTLEKALPEVYDNPFAENDRVLCEYHPAGENESASPFRYSLGTGWSSVSLGEESRCERVTISFGVQQIKPKEERNGSVLDMWI